MKYCVLLFFTAAALTAQTASEHPDWIPIRPGEEQRLEDETAMSAPALTILGAQANSPDPVHQRQAITGIREMIANGEIPANDPEAVDLLYSIAGQAFLRSETPPPNHFRVRVAAIRALGQAGDTVQPQLLSLLQREPDPTAAAEAALALRDIDIGPRGQEIITTRLRHSRAVDPNDRLTAAMLQLARQELTRRPLQASLVDEIIRTYSGPFVYEVRALAESLLLELRED